MIRIEEYTYQPDDQIYLLVDRMSCDDTKDAVSRLTDSAETAMYEGDGACLLRFYLPTDRLSFIVSAPSLKRTESSSRNPATRCFIQFADRSLPHLRRLRKNHRHR